MPVMDGFEASRNLRRMMNKFEVLPCPIIGCPAAGTMSKSQREEYFANGMTDIRKRHRIISSMQTYHKKSARRHNEQIQNDDKYNLSQLYVRTYGVRM